MIRPTRDFEMIESTFNGVAWVSDRKGLPPSHDDDEVDFETSKDWQEYLRVYQRDLFVYLQVDDRTKLLIRTRKSDDGLTDVSVFVPAQLFLGDRAKQDVYRDIKLETYQWLAKKYGWPEPPPLPPLTVRRTYRKNYRPPADEAPD